MAPPECRPLPGVSIASSAFAIEPLPIPLMCCPTSLVRRFRTPLGVGLGCSCLVLPCFAEAPTDVLFSNHGIMEGSPANLIVATMTAVDPDAGDTHTFQLVSGTGGEHNNGFFIAGNKLHLRYVLDRDYETESITWNVRIRVTDSTGQSFDKITQFFMTDDRQEDADGDGLTEEEEEDIYGTSDVDYDSDNDGVGDGAEVAAGTSPTDPNDWPTTSILGWGNQSRGELAAPAGGGFAAISTGQNHSLALRTDGSVTAWGGFNTFGQKSVPAGLGGVVEVAAGGDFWVEDSAHNLALQQDGTVVSWGYTHNGNLVLPGDLDQVVSVATGRSFCLALRDDGTVRAWGYIPRGSIQPPAGLGEVVAISAGGFHAVALRQNGSVVSWGTTFNGTEWVETSAPKGLSDVVQVAAGRFHSLALRRDGTVRSWGYNSHGQTSVPAGLGDVVAVAAGGFHSLALKSDGSVVAWGANSQGQCSIPPSAQGDVRWISAGLQHSLALRQDEGYPRISSDTHVNGAPGEELHHQITVEDAAPAAFWVSGLPDGLSLDPATGAITGTPLAPARMALRIQATTDQGVLSQIAWLVVSEGEAPTAILVAPNVVLENSPQGALVGLLTATDADAGDTHHFELVDGEGDTDNFRFRIQGDRLEVNEFIASDYEQGPVAFSVRVRAVDFSLNSFEQSLTLVLGDDRTEDADGDGLTQEEEEFYQTSDLVADTDGDGFSDGYEVALGTDPAAAADVPQGNLIVAWGDTSAGQAARLPPPGADFLDVSAGWRHTLGLRVDGTVGAWGANDHGQTEVPEGLAGVSAVSAGDLHSIALRDDGHVVAWGNDEFGQGSVPEGLDDVIGVSAGANHNLALRADGTVAAWGNDEHGQCQVPPGLADVIAVSAGGFHSLALRGDGTVVAWGSDWSGISTVPAGLAGVVGIAAGGYHSLALRHDGTVVAWGANDQNQCVVPTGLAGVRQVSAGWLFSAALRNDGGVRAWGDSACGQCVVPMEAAHIKALDAGDEFVVAIRQQSGFPRLAGTSPVRAWPGNGIDRQLAVENTVASAYEAIGLPADLSLEPLTGAISGTVASGARRAVRVGASTEVGTLSAIMWINTADGIAPTNISLSPAFVMENAPAGSFVGSLTASDPDPGDSFSYELDFSPGVPDSFRFEVFGNELRTRYPIDFDYEVAPVTFTIRVIATDSGGNSFAKNLSVALADDRDEDADGDGYSEAFEEDVLGTSDQVAGDVPRSDIDGDGIPSVIELAFNLPHTVPGPPVYLVPGAGSTAGLPAIHLVPDGSGGHRLRMEYLRRTDGLFTYQPQFGDGTGWPPAVGTVTVTPAGEGWERCVVEDVAGSGAPRRFGRVAVGP